jgi:hypothetical protein
MFKPECMVRKAASNGYAEYAMHTEGEAVWYMVTEPTWAMNEILHYRLCRLLGIQTSQIHHGLHEGTLFAASSIYNDAVLHTSVLGREIRNGLELQCQMMLYELFSSSLSSSSILVQPDGFIVFNKHWNFLSTEYLRCLMFGKPCRHTVKSVCSLYNIYNLIPEAKTVMFEMAKLTDAEILSACSFEGVLSKDYIQDKLSQYLFSVRDLSRRWCDAYEDELLGTQKAP